MKGHLPGGRWPFIYGVEEQAMLLLGSFLLFQLSGVIEGIPDGNGNEDPDEKTNWPREEHRKAAL